jgi:hypothetical protein
MIPLYLKTGELTDPDDELYYLVAGNGVFLVKRSEVFTAITRVQDVAGLEVQTPALTLTIPKLPRSLMEKIYGFFDIVYRRWDGEAVVFLFYSPENGRFHVDAPPQTLVRRRTSSGWRTESHVEYKSLPRPEGFLWLGDVHSHCDLGAFFSATDDHDDGQDGLRIVMGRLDRHQPDVCASFVTGGTRFELAAEDVIENFRGPVTPPPVWLERVSFRCKGFNESYS